MYSADYRVEYSLSNSNKTATIKRSFPQSSDEAAHRWAKVAYNSPAEWEAFLPADAKLKGAKLLSLEQVF